MRVPGHLNMSDEKLSFGLPSDLTVDVLTLRNCQLLSKLPSGLKVGRLTLDGCNSLADLPPDLMCNELIWQRCPLSAWPNVAVKHHLNLEGSPNLERLPSGLKVGRLWLNHCSALTCLPEGIDVYFLDMRGCIELARWPEKGSVQIGRLNVRDCRQLTALPKWLSELGQVDLRGCANISELPDRLSIRSWIDIGGTGIRCIPETISERCLRWRGVPVTKRIVFDSKSITAEEILEERNVERRRVLLELMGYEAFLKDARAVVLDTDRDAGGERKLLTVPLKGDENLVCVSVICPSTQRQYIIRVPPKTKSCRMAAAWIAGFDREDEYRLIAET